MKYRLSPKQISSTLSDEVIVLNHAKGAYYGLDNVGAVVWEQLQKEPSTIGDLVVHVTTVYDIDSNQCKTDIQEFIDELISEKLVEIVS